MNDGRVIEDVRAAVERPRQHLLGDDETGEIVGDGRDLAGMSQVPAALEPVGAERRVDIDHGGRHLLAQGNGKDPLTLERPAHQGQDVQARLVDGGHESRLDGARRDDENHGEGGHDPDDRLGGAQDGEAEGGVAGRPGVDRDDDGGQAGRPIDVGIRADLEARHKPHREEPGGEAGDHEQAALSEHRDEAEPRHGAQDGAQQARHAPPDREPGLGPHDERDRDQGPIGMGEIEQERRVERQQRGRGHLGGVDGGLGIGAAAQALRRRRDGSGDLAAEAPGRCGRIAMGVIGLG